MRKIFFLCLLSVVVCPVLAEETNDLAVARAALRDGLWEVARTHALKDNSDTAKLIVLEAYAHEGNWKGLLAAYDAMGYPAGEGFSYYRAAALFKDGSAVSASNVLAGVVITNAAFVRPAARLRAELALADRNPGVALSILEDEGGDDVETKLMIASIRAGSGNLDESKLLWREVAANTNASERARATAAVGLRDAAQLAELSTNAVSGSVRRFAALRLGTLLIADAATFAQGERLVRETVRDKPDAEGAREAFLALADARLAHGEFSDAEKTYADALVIWPDMAKNASLHEGRGWALVKLGQHGKALEEFRCAEELAADPERKAAAAVKAADALAALGRGKDATEAYRKVRQDYPNTTAAVRIDDVIRLREMEDKGRTLYREFKFDEASRVFEALAKEEPVRRERLAFYGVLCAYGAGNDDRAETMARQLADGARDAAVKADATHWLAKFAYNRRNWREAEKDFVRFVEMSPASPEAPGALVWSARAALADNDFQAAISNVARLVSGYPAAPECAAGMLAQGEALIELGRFDEAVLVLDRAAIAKGVSAADRLGARIMRADALFAMGADNPARYKTALEAYNAIRTNEALTPDAEISIAFKTAKTLEKLKRTDDALDAYYTQVVLAYRTGRLAGIHYDESARAAFARAAFRLAEEYESRGRIRQAVHVLELVRTSDVRTAGEAAKRIDKLTRKGMLP